MSDVDCLLPQNDECKSAPEQGDVLVDFVRKFRDRYFENRDVEQYAEKKKGDVEKLTAKALETLDQLDFSKKDKAYYYMLKGKLMNILPDYNPECLEVLTTAIKLNPKLPEAWCELGECHWKNGDVQAAYNAFKSALDHQTDKIVLRNLSMVLRHLSSKSSNNRDEQMIESVEKAKQAVQMDLNDGTSWMVLGNAYFSGFIQSPLNAGLLNKAMAAYSRADKDLVAKADPYLHYNWGIALQYQDDFSGALNAFHQSRRLDPSWENPRIGYENLRNYLLSVENMVNSKGKVKNKRFREMVASLRSAKIKELGPFSGGTYVSGQGKEVNLEFASLADLKAGNNNSKVILVRVLCGIASESEIVLTLVVCDESGTVAVMRIFNLGSGVGPTVGDSIAVPDPFLENIDMKIEKESSSDDEHKLNFKFVRVPLPDVLVVNGRRIKSKWTGLPQIQNVFLSE